MSPLKILFGQLMSMFIQMGGHFWEEYAPTRNVSAEDHLTRNYLNVIAGTDPIL